MPEASKNTTADVLYTSVGRIISNIATVLSHTKEALLKDFLGDMQNYLPEVTNSGNYTYETFKANLKQGETPLGKFIESLFTRLGYDVSSFEENKELADNIKSIIAATISFGEGVKELMDDRTDWMEEARKFMESSAVGTTEGSKKSVTAKEFFADPDLDKIGGVSIGNDNVSISLDFGEGFGKISAIIRLIIDLVSLIRNLRDMEWGKLKREYEDFGNFLEETYFTEKFAERIFDHILTVMLREAKEVFAEDINAIIDHIDEVKNNIINEVKEEVKGRIDDIIKQIKSLRKEILELEKKIEAEALRLYNEAQALGKEVVREVSTELQTQLKVAKATLEKLTSEAFPNYNNLGKIFSQIYAVLDFLQVIKNETIELAKYIPNAPSIPTIDMGSVDQLIRQANEATININKGVANANNQMEVAVTGLKSLCRPIEIKVINWSALEELCTDPIDYFKKIYPIKDYSDAEKLLTKILEVARIFNSDIPDFGSLKQLLYEFLIRIRNRIKDEASPLARDIKEKFAKFENFIIDLLKVLEKFAVGVKKELKVAYNNFEEQKDSLIGQLKEGVNTAITEYKDLGGTLRNFTIPDTNIKFKNIRGVDYGEIKGYLKKAFADSFIRIIGEKAKEHDLFGNIKPDEWKTAIEKSIGDNLNGNLIKEYKAVLDEMQKYVTDLFSQDKWKEQFDGIISGLKTEFERQTEKVPDNFNEVKDFCKGSLEKLINGDDLQNPFSDFDFTAYFSILADKIKAMVPDNPDIYYVKFREITVGSVKALMASSEAGFKAVAEKAKGINAKEYEDKLRAFAIDVFTAYWEELKKSLYRTIVQPFRTLIERAVKTWINDILIPRIIDFVEDNIISQLNFNAYKEVFDDVEEFVEDAKKVYDDVREGVGEAKAWAKDATLMATNILMLAQDAKDIDSWKDGLQFAFKLYKIIPKSIKSYLREFIDLPDWNFENVRLPDYSLDVKNKFLAVTLYEYPGKGGVTSDNFTADVSIRFVAFVGDRKVKDQKGDIKKDDDGDDIVESGLYLLPILRGKFGTNVNIGDSHYLSLNANTEVNPDVTATSANNDSIKDKLESDALGFFFTTKNGELSPTAELLSSTSAISAYLELLFQRGQKEKNKDVPPLEIFKADVAEMTIKDYPQKLFLGYSGGFDIGYLGGVRDLILKLKLRELNDFFEIILKNDIDIKIEKLDIGYSLKKGFQFDGAYKLNIPLSTSIDLKIIKFSNINLELGSGNFKNVLANLLTNFTVDFKGIAISFHEMGFGVDINYMAPGGGFGDLDLSPKIQFPTGLGISIDMEAIKGTGIIKWDKKKEEFLGAIELNILEICSVGAIVLFNMKMPDGSKGFSFMGALCVFFKSGIQLGMGFSLTAIGGSLGINRRIDTDKLRNAVRDGSLASIIFVKDLDKNLDSVLANISSYYPIQKEQIFFGFLAEITWVEILKVKLGLFIQAPNPTSIIIAGSLSVTIADMAQSLFAINVHFLGEIEFSKGLSFDASLVDSHIMGIQFYGDMALRIYWGGDTKGFLLSAGGFHPQFKPDAGFRVGDMKRLGMKLDYSIVKLSFDTYFAVTSNTVQFGAKVQLQIGWKKFGISGYLYFDTLFQFKPFMFMFEVGAGVSVKCGSWTLLSLTLRFALSGPAKWHVEGTASFWFLFIKIGVDFSKTWGKSQSVSNKKYIEILPIYVENFHENNNWKIISGDIVDNLVKTIKIDSSNLVMHPSAILSFTQSAVPLNEDMTCYGEAYPGDAQKIIIKGINIGDETIDYTETVTSFAPTLIRKLSKEQKLKAKSYQNMGAGFELKEGFGLEKGPGEEIEPKMELICQDINWEHWIEYAAANVKPDKVIAKTPAVDEKKVVIENQDRITDSQRLYIGIKDAAASGSFVSKASFRRTAEGFRRYTLALNRSMSKKINDSIEELSMDFKK